MKLHVFAGVMGSAVPQVQEHWAFAKGAIKNDKLKIKNAARRRVDVFMNVSLKVVFVMG